MTSWLKSARLSAGISQSEIARRTSLYQANISEIENGFTNPNMSTVEEYLSALGLKLIPVSRSIPSIQEFALEMGLALTQKKSERTLRLLIEFVNQVKKLNRDDFIFATTSRPTSTGDERYDALLAATVEYLHVERKLPRPNWVTASRYKLREPWIVDKYATKQDNLGKITPKQFLDRNILISPTEFVSV